MGMFDWEPPPTPAAAPVTTAPAGAAAAAVLTATTAEAPPSVLTLQDTCWRVVQRGVTCTNVVELMTYMDHYNLPETHDVRAHCMRYVERAYATLRQRRGVPELQQQLPAALFTALEEAYAASDASAAARGIRGRILEPEKPGEDCRQDIPSVTGCAHSYRLSALVTGMAWPADVDPQNREQHLGAPEFEAVLGSTYAQYLAKPAWKRRVIKADAALF